MVRAPDAGRRHSELVGIGLGVSDELGNRLGRNRWVHHHGETALGDARDRRDVADEIETGAAASTSLVVSSNTGLFGFSRKPIVGVLGTNSCKSASPLA